jgi:hypothetical protein
LVSAANKPAAIVNTAAQAARNVFLVMP